MIEEEGGVTALESDKKIFLQREERKQQIKYKFLKMLCDEKRLRNKNICNNNKINNDHKKMMNE